MKLRTTIFLLPWKRPQCSPNAGRWPVAIENAVPEEHGEEDDKDGVQQDLDETEILIGHKHEK